MWISVIWCVRFLSFYILKILFWKLLTKVALSNSPCNYLTAIIGISHIIITAPVSQSVKIVSCYWAVFVHKIQVLWKTSTESLSECLIKKKKTPLKSKHSSVLYLLLLISNPHTAHTNSGQQQHMYSIPLSWQTSNTAIEVSI